MSEVRLEDLAATFEGMLKVYPPSEPATLMRDHEWWQAGLASIEAAIAAAMPHLNAPTAMILDEGSPERTVEAAAVDGGWIVGFRVGNAMDGFDRVNALIDAAQPHITAPAPEPDGEALRARIAELEAALEAGAVWHDAQDKALSKQPPGGDRQWRRMEHQEQAADLRRAADVMGERARCRSRTAVP